MINEPAAKETVARIEEAGGRPSPCAPSSAPADAVAVFASDDGRWVTGQTLEVNGGLLLGPTGER